VTGRRWVLSGIAVILGISGIFAAVTFRSALPEIMPPTAASFDPALVSQGLALARLGNCTGCHTVQGGTPFAGGRPLQTPFGTIYATNITPAPESGIGGWSPAAFRRAMREGIARDGSHLYPAFPYDHFTRASDAEVDALYAFLMTRPAVERRPPENRLVWPLDHRFLVAGWNLLFLREGPAESPDRGSTLVEGLAHCGGCHTPRNRLGAEDKDRAYNGAWNDGWYAPPLNQYSPAASKWTADELFLYLRNGPAARHAGAAGPMAGVTRELSAAPEAEVRAIAAYFARLMIKAPGATVIDQREAADEANPEGAALFAGACGACHESGAPMMQQGRPSLTLSTSLRLQTPHNALHVIDAGLRTPGNRAGPAMPAFGDDLSEQQIARIAAYLRARFTDFPPWQNLDRALSDVRKGAQE
jgi:mono/diheme cytochrome c family protein